ncbi:DUF2169 domain-containing protein [Desulfoluna sp.]|uniref:DUF2169 family type VI secretion system accessory protein n=1 Tax=Desulfoluna sp. TaxID=2045199 RepID=UPI00261CE67D|nr:DUF2169 domain-containing protein [Desulfoluna sp.]
MWVVENKTPFDAVGTFTRNQVGAEVWVVAVKGTFTVAEDGSVTVADRQEPVCRAPVYTGEPGHSSMKYDVDLISGKPATDVIMHANATAPGGKPVKKLDVWMRVGGVQKRFRVTGDHHWRRGIFTSKTPVQPFVRIPIVYERAFGGCDLRHKKSKKQGYEARNPVGTGYVRVASHRKEMQVPNICFQGKKQRRAEPAGFGPISAHWEPRASFMGTCDEAWAKNRKPLLPEDFDSRYYQQAPADQQAEGYLQGGEPVTLVNVSQSGRLRFNLPEVKPRCATLIGNDVVDHDINLYTVILEPEESRLMMVWHCAFECHNREHLLERSIVRMK